MTTSTGTSSSNGIDLDEVGRLYEQVLAADAAVPLEVRTRHSWADGGTVDGRGERMVAPSLGTEWDRSHHRLRTDLPVAMGGSDAAPSPGETLLGALAGCIGATMTLAATVAGVGLDAFEVATSAEVDVRGTFGVEGVPVGLSAITVEIDVRADAPGDEVEQLVHEAVRLSPVAATLSGALPLEVRVHQP